MELDPMSQFHHKGYALAYTSAPEENGEEACGQCLITCEIGRHDVNALLLAP